MISPRISNYINSIIQHINYSADRYEIQLELENHLTDRIEFYMQKDSDKEAAEKSAIRDMGDAKEIGRQLNKAHKPLLGWILKNLKTFTLIGLTIIICIAVFYAGANYARNQKIKRDTRSFINGMHFELFITTHLLENVENWNDYSIRSLDFTSNPFSRLLLSLQTMKVYSETAISYMDPENTIGQVRGMSDSFNLIYLSIGGGITYNDQLICYDFLKDDILSDKEINFLKVLRDDLSVIQESLLNKETNRSNDDFSLEEFAEIIKPFVKKYQVSNLKGIGLGN